MSECKADREDIRAHLQMMQSVITRMADNSRACKTWAVTLVAAILVVVARFGGSDDESAFDKNAALLALVPALMFWVLDSYYLALEQSFRDSYKSFVSNLQAGKPVKSLVFKIEKSGPMMKNLLKSQKSFVILPFYLAMTALIVVLWLLLR